MVLLPKTGLEINAVETLMKIKNIKDLNAFIYENTNIPVYRVIGMTSIGAVKAFVLRYLINYSNKRSI